MILDILIKIGSFGFYDKATLDREIKIGLFVSFDKLILGRGIKIGPQRFVCLLVSSLGFMAY